MNNLMIPICLFNLDEACSAHLIASLYQCATLHGAKIHMEFNTDSAEEVIAFATSSSQAIICVIGIDRLRSRDDLMGIKMSRKLLGVNRDHYIVLVLQHAGDLEDVLSVCTHLAGVLCVPFTTKRIDRIFNIILNDYCMRKNAELTETKGNIALKAGNNVYRISHGEIRYAQALDKKIEVVLEARTLQIYSNMTEIQKRLGDTFVRCHRSYIVNRKYVKEINWTEMMLSMTDGTRIPLSRTYKHELKEVIEHDA